MATGAGAILRRKALGEVQGPRPEPAVTPARALRRAVARAGGVMDLPVSVIGIDDRLTTLDEVLAALDESHVIHVLERDGQPIGLAVCDLHLRNVLVEVQTLGAVTLKGPPKKEVLRKVTNADAALARPLIDAILAETALAGSGTDLTAWSEGCRCGERYRTRREIGAVLTACDLRVIRLSLDPGPPDRQCEITFMLPPPGSGEVQADDDGGAAAKWHETFATHVMGAPATLNAILARLAIPLREAENWTVGDVVPLTGVTVSSVVVESQDRQVVSPGRLGQVAGRRAIRLELPEPVAMGAAGLGGRSADAGLAIGDDGGVDLGDGADFDFDGGAGLDLDGDAGLNLEGGAATGDDGVDAMADFAAAPAMDLDDGPDMADPMEPADPLDEAPAALGEDSSDALGDDFAPAGMADMPDDAPAAEPEADHDDDALKAEAAPLDLQMGDDAPPDPGGGSEPGPFDPASPEGEALDRIGMGRDAAPRGAPTPAAMPVAPAAGIPSSPPPGAAPDPDAPAPAAPRPAAPTSEPEEELAAPPLFSRRAARAFSNPAIAPAGGEPQQPDPLPQAPAAAQHSEMSTADHGSGGPSVAGDEPHTAQPPEPPGGGVQQQGPASEPDGPAAGAPDGSDSEGPQPPAAEFAQDQGWQRAAETGDKADTLGAADTDDGAEMAEPAPAGTFGRRSVAGPAQSASSDPSPSDQAGGPDVEPAPAASLSQADGSGPDGAAPGRGPELETFDHGQIAASGEFPDEVHLPTEAVPSGSEILAMGAGVSSEAPGPDSRYAIADSMIPEIDADGNIAPDAAVSDSLDPSKLALDGD